MKKRKLLLFIFIGLFTFLLSQNVYADSCMTDECFDSQEAAINNIHNNELMRDVGGEKVMYLPTVPFLTSDDDLINTRYMIKTLQAILDKYYIYTTNNIDPINKTMELYDYYSVNGMGAYTYYETVKYEFVDPPNNTYLEKANELISKINKEEYVIEDLATLNFYWNFGEMGEYFLNVETPDMLYYFQELKNILTNDDVFEYDLRFVGYSLNQNDFGHSDSVILYLKKDGFYYGAVSFRVKADFFFRVDENGEGSLTERVANRIINYLGEETSFYIEPITNGDKVYNRNGTDYNVKQYKLYFKRDEEKVNEYYGSYCQGGPNDDNYYFCGHLPFVETDESYYYKGNQKAEVHSMDRLANPYYILSVAEVPSEEIKNFEVSNIDPTTGIQIITDSFDVPLDALVSSESKKDNQSILDLLKQYDYKMIDAYNIDIYGNSSGNRIESIYNGVEVYIPLEGYNEGDIITIRHIKDDGSLGEELKGTVVKVDGKLFAKFKTTHFSTYALVELNNTTEEISEVNPPTGDNIMNYTMILFISLAMMFSTFYIYKNNKNN